MSIIQVLYQSLVLKRRSQSGGRVNCSVRQCCWVFWYSQDRSMPNRVQPTSTTSLPRHGCCRKFNSWRSVVGACQKLQVAQLIRFTRHCQSGNSCGNRKPRPPSSSLTAKTIFIYRCQANCGCQLDKSQAQEGPVFCSGRRLRQCFDQQAKIGI